MTPRWDVNLTPAEQEARILLGLVGAGGAAFLLAGAGSLVAVILALLLLVAGLDLVVTGATGHCPLYKKLGHVPTSLQRRTR